MAWSTIATLTPSKQWAFTPASNAIFFRVKHTDSPFAPILWICQAAIDDSGLQLFDVKKLSEDYLNQVIRLESPPIFSDRVIGIKSNIDTSRWQVQIEASDYIPVTNTTPISTPIFDPKSIPGLLAWYKSDAGVILNGSAVSRWEDQSDNKNHAASPYLDAFPTLKTNALNKLPALYFDGANDTLNLTSAINNQNYSIFVIIKKYTGATVICGGYGSLQYRVDNIQSFVKTYVTGMGQGNASLPSDFCQVNATYDGANCYFRMNKRDDGSNSSPQTFSNPVLSTIGRNGYANNEWLQADLIELLIYSALPLKSIQQVEDYLNNRIIGK